MTTTYQANMRDTFADTVTELMAGDPRISVVLADVSGVDLERREVIAEDHRIGFDILIVGVFDRVCHLLDAIGLPVERCEKRSCLFRGQPRCHLAQGRVLRHLHTIVEQDGGGDELEVAAFGLLDRLCVPPDPLEVREVVGAILCGLIDREEFASEFVKREKGGKLVAGHPFYFKRWSGISAMWVDGLSPERLQDVRSA